MTFLQIEEILSKIKYKNWFIELYGKPNAYTLRLSWFDNCVVTGKKELQTTREWYLDPEGLTEDSIVRTVHKAILNAEEHEVNERFLYKGKKIYNPHVSVNNLMEVCDREDNI